MNSNTNKRRLNDVDSDTGKAPDPRNQSITTPTIFASSPITDRASTFIAHFHPHDPSQPSTSKSTTQTIKAFQNDPAFSTADHRMAAWRRASTQRTLLGTGGGASGVTYTTSSDDDGEKYAGKRLEKVLNELNVQGTVVVARWYGGVLLGPVRFTHIENVARDAIARWTRRVGGAGAGDAQSGGGGGKRVKTGDDSSPASGLPAKGAPTEAQKAADEATRLRLAEQLVYRDNSIAVLRALLAEKKNEQQQQQRIVEGNTEKLGQQQQQESTDPAIAGSSPALDSNNLKGKGNLASQSASLPDATPPSPSAARAAEMDAVSKHASASTSTSPINPSSVSPAPPSTATANTTATKPHAQPLDYTVMPLARLRQLEKARDATIAFILKQIDKAEADEKKVTANANANGEGDGDGDAS